MEIQRRISLRACFTVEAIVVNLPVVLPTRDFRTESDNLSATSAATFLARFDLLSTYSRPTFGLFRGVARRFEEPPGHQLRLELLQDGPTGCEIASEKRSSESHVKSTSRCVS